MRHDLSSPIDLQPYSFETFYSVAHACWESCANIVAAAVHTANLFVERISPLLQPAAQEQAQFAEILIQFQAHSKQFKAAYSANMYPSSDANSLLRERWTPYDQAAWKRYEVSVVNPLMPLLASVRSDLNAVQKHIQLPSIDVTIREKEANRYESYGNLLAKLEKGLARMETLLTADPW